MNCNITHNSSSSLFYGTPSTFPHPQCKFKVLSTSKGSSLHTVGPSQAPHFCFLVLFIVLWCVFNHSCKEILVKEIHLGPPSTIIIAIVEYVVGYAVIMTYYYLSAFGLISWHGHLHTTLHLFTIMRIWVKMGQTYSTDWSHRASGQASLVFVSIAFACGRV